MKKNLILGIITSYGWTDIEPFFVSWQKNFSNADCVIFYDDISDWTMEQFDYLNNDEQLECIDEDNGKLKLIKIPEEYKDRLVIDIRCSLYKEFLNAHKNEYKQALLTDVRDVIFQGNLFKPLESYENYLGYATEEKTLEEKTNRSWLLKFFNDEEYQKIKEKKIICNGTIFGTINELIIYLTKMEQILSTKKAFWGADQAVANYLIYNKLLPIKILIESDVNNGIILTNGWRETEVKDDKMMNFNKKIPAVVHQYDRHGNLFKLIDRIYRLDELYIPKEYDDLKSNLDIINAFITNSNYRMALDKLLNLNDEYNDENEWLESFERLLRMLTFINLLKTRTLSIELLNQAISHLITKVLNGKFVNFYRLDKLHVQLLKMKKKDFTIYKPFENLIGDMIWSAASYFDENNNSENVLTCFNNLKNLDYELTEEQYLVSAKHNRLLGNVSEALEDYKKALELSNQNNESEN